MAEDAENITPFRPRLPVRPERTWATPLDMLHELVADIEAGRVQPDAIVVGMREVRNDATEEFVKTPMWTMGFTRHELIGLLFDYARMIP